MGGWRRCQILGLRLTESAIPELGEINQLVGISFPLRPDLFD